MLNLLLSAHTQNAPSEICRRYQTDFIRDSNHNSFFCVCRVVFKQYNESVAISPRMQGKFVNKFLKVMLHFVLSAQPPGANISNS